MQKYSSATFIGCLAPGDNTESGTLFPVYRAHDGAILVPDANRAQRRVFGFDILSGVAPAGYYAMGGEPIVHELRLGDPLPTVYAITGGDILYARDEDELRRLADRVLGATESEVARATVFAELARIARSFARLEKALWLILSGRRRGLPAHIVRHHEMLRSLRFSIADRLGLVMPDLRSAILADKFSLEIRGQECFYEMPAHIGRALLGFDPAIDPLVKASADGLQLTLHLAAPAKSQAA